MTAGDKASIRRRVAEVVAEQWDSAPAGRLKVERVHTVQRLVLDEVLAPGVLSTAGRTARHAVFVRGADPPLRRSLQGDHQALRKLDVGEPGYRAPAVATSLVGLPASLAAAARRTLRSWAAASPGGRWPEVRVSLEQERVARCRVAGSGQTFWIALESGRLLTYTERFVGASRVVGTAALMMVTFGACPAGFVFAPIGVETGLWGPETARLVVGGGFFTSVCLVLLAVVRAGRVRGPIGSFGPPR